jgi:tetratricopeptide (TPR) repeat protein
MNRHPRLRRPLLSAVFLPALLVLAFGIKVGLMVQDDRAGRDAFDRGDYDGSQAAFAENRTLNFLEPWIAPFDEGTAHHAEGQYDDAITDYEAALEHVPDREECTVRINLALAHESVGDALAAQRDREAAVESWQAGIDVLAAGGCPESSGRGKEQTKDAETVDKRLRQKIEQQQQEQPSEQEPQQPPPQQPEGEEPQDPRQQELERNNERGLEQRRDDRELYEGRDYSRPYTW